MKRDRISGMKRLALVLVMSMALGAMAQSAPTPPPAVIKEISPLLYPPLARQAQIDGTVEIDVVLRSDGQLDTATVLSGHPMLKEAALESARHSKFDCVGCTESLNTRRISYKFELGDPVDCTPVESNSDYAVSSRPCLRQSGNNITLISPKFELVCGGPTVSVSFRSVRCLYLWTCGRKPA